MGSLHGWDKIGGTSVISILCRFTLFVVFGMVVVSSPPADPIKCGKGNGMCTITNSYGAFPDRAVCEASKVVYPASEKELVEVVAAAAKSQRKMKVATRFSHSIPKLVCPDGRDGLLIRTDKLNRVVEVDATNMTIVVESGVTLREVIEAAANAGMALPYTPYWWGLTIGGLLATGAHGSTLWGGSSVHDHVEEVRIVTPAGPEDGFAKVRVVDGSQEHDMNAVKVSLGVLGVVSQVKLKLQPMFKRSVMYSVKNDSDLGDMAVEFGRQHEFGDIFWYPSQRRAVYRTDDRVPVDTPGNGLYDFDPFRPTPSLSLALIRSTEELQESTNDAVGKCGNAKLVTSALITHAYGLTNNGLIFTGYPVTGFQNRMQSSGTCLDSPRDGLLTACAWDSRIKGEFFHQTTLSISLSRVKQFIEDVQLLVALDPKSLCGVELYNGILMRYVKASPAFLGKQEDSIDFDMTYYRSKDPTSPRMYEDALEEIEQMAVFKYGALPHWGKNRNVAFLGAIGKYGRSHGFLKVKDRYDPTGLFSSEWTDKVLGIDGDGVTIEGDGCALEGLCICSEDGHCAPGKGYYCRPGKVYSDARVCIKIHN
ncbi:hypothetical protein MLD38_017946 [Melastoma candidum]|uniref:Uncharacterized protein n=1 Tax=Melastoma candidum TaxID=119954 RepID=A0ACB9QTK7_9MYRT|nr:hypothetical protein MLD38_017946 [Melastoma candidum]